MGDIRMIGAHGGDITPRNAVPPLRFYLVNSLKFNGGKRPFGDKTFYHLRQIYFRQQKRR